MKGASIVGILELLHSWMDKLADGIGFYNCQLLLFGYYGYDLEPHSRTLG